MTCNCRQASGSSVFARWIRACTPSHGMPPTIQDTERRGRGDLRRADHPVVRHEQTKCGDDEERPREHAEELREELLARSCPEEVSGLQVGEHGQQRLDPLSFGERKESRVPRRPPILATSFEKEDADETTTPLRRVKEWRTTSRNPIQDTDSSAPRLSFQDLVKRGDLNIADGIWSGAHANKTRMARSPLLNSSAPLLPADGRLHHRQVG